MTKTELLDRVARDGEERLLLARALDKLELTRQRNVPSHTGFLSPQERVSVDNLLHAAGHPRHIFYGGFEGAERTVCAFLPDWQEPEDWAQSEDCPVCALHCTFSEEADLSHRDFLGSVLGLGITREKAGDFLVARGSCTLLVLRELEDYLMQNLESAGRTRLRCKPLPLEQIVPPEIQIRLIRDTVATLRLDAVAASAFSLSRGKAAELIASGRVQLNHRACVKPDRAVSQGDALSCRGLGKCVVKEVGGLSKKGRTMLVLERYL